MENQTAPHLITGHEAEAAGLQHLLKAGLTLLEKNFRSPYGEIDLVMLDKNELVFIEVRYRKNQQFGGAIESVAKNKIRKLRNTAEMYLQQHQSLSYSACRFDMLAVTGRTPDYKVEWIAEAF